MILSESTYAYDALDRLTSETIDNAGMPEVVDQTRIPEQIVAPAHHIGQNLKHGSSACVELGTAADRRMRGKRR